METSLDTEMDKQKEINADDTLSEENIASETTSDSPIVENKPVVSEENDESEPTSDSRKVENKQVVNEEKNGDKAAKETGEVENGSCDPKNVRYEGDVAVYTDPNTGTEYEWSKEKNEWILKQTVQFENDTHVYTDKDGVKFFWDKDKSAWFPQIDSDFMAQYQMNYGFVDNQKPEEKEEEPEKLVEPKAPKGEKRKATEPSWFELSEVENTKVYVTNLPLNITEQEFIDLMQKCGLVMRDPSTGSFKIKLYKEPGTDHLKGDALCTYIRVESVHLALSLLDGCDYKGHKLKVERAKFQMKGDYDPNLKPKMKKRKEKLKLKKVQEKLLDWRPEKKMGDRAKHEKVVIVKNLFEPSIFDTDVGLILEFQEDLREESAKIGTCRKVIIYDRHPGGVAQINMSSPEEADEVVKMLNGRWFMKRQLAAEIWDGKTKFKIAETDAQMNQRLDGWDKFLEEPGEQKPKEAEKPSVEK